MAIFINSCSNHARVSGVTAYSRACTQLHECHPTLVRYETATISIPYRSSLRDTTAVEEQIATLRVQTHCRPAQQTLQAPVPLHTNTHTRAYFAWYLGETVSQQGMRERSPVSRAPANAAPRRRRPAGGRRRGRGFTHADRRYSGRIAARASTLISSSVAIRLARVVRGLPSRTAARKPASTSHRQYNYAVSPHSDWTIGLFRPSRTRV